MRSLVKVCKLLFLTIWRNNFISVYWFYSTLPYMLLGTLEALSTALLQLLKLILKSYVVLLNFSNISVWAGSFLCRLSLNIQMLGLLRSRWMHGKYRTTMTSSRIQLVHYHTPFAQQIAFPIFALKSDHSTYDDFYSDLKTISKRVESEQYYITLEMFASDMRRMFINARTYNSPDTIYYKCTNRYVTFIMLNWQLYSF